MKNKNGYKRAFTLTELLVVVVVIGVLAALTLPKFSKVLETRKTTEAENILRAVRTEQERRCALDKNYLGDLNKMPDLVPNTTTANYTYAALTGGIRAQSNGSLNYQLQMPSYADGRICCTGTDCSQLNKDYLLCDDLIARADYVPSGECSFEEEEPTNPEPPTPPTPPTPTECTAPKPADDGELAPCDGALCGQKRKGYICEDGNWIVTWNTTGCAPCNCTYGWVGSAQESEVVTCSYCQQIQSLAPTPPCTGHDCFFCTVHQYGPVDVNCSFHHCQEGGRGMVDPGGEQNFNCDDHGQGSNMYMNPVAYCTMTYKRNMTCQLASGDPNICPHPQY